MLVKYKFILIAGLFQAISSCNALHGLGGDMQGLGNALNKTSNYRVGSPANYYQAPQPAYAPVYRQPVRPAVAMKSSVRPVAPVYTAAKIAPAPIPVSTYAPKPITAQVARPSVPLNSTSSELTKLTGNMKRLKTSPYTVRGIRYTPLSPQAALAYKEAGVCSFYGTHVGKNAIGDTGSYGGLTGAHKTLPLPSIVRVTNVANGKSVVVRINDRGPFVNGRILDLSNKTKAILGENGKGLIDVRMDVLAVGDVNQIRN